jgi:hypothetical protein
LKRLQQQKSRKDEQYELLEREANELLIQNTQLREELSGLKGVNPRNNIMGSKIINGNEPTYTNLGNEAMRIDKFPGKIGYIPKKK